VAPALTSAKNTQYDVQLLREWKLRWANHKLVVAGLAKLFMYLDRFYTPNTDNVLILKEQGFKLYKEHIFTTFAPAARTAILSSIEKERNNEEQDRALLKEAVEVFVGMGQCYDSKKLLVYTEDLQKFIVAETGTYYQRKSREWMEQDSCPIYLERVEKVLAAETSRCGSYMNQCTLELLLKEIYVQMLQMQQKDLLRKKTGLHNLLAQNAVEDLARLYRLYKADAADLDPIGEMFEEFITQAGTAIVDAAKVVQAAPVEEEKKASDAAAAGSSAAPTAAAADVNHALVRNLIGLHAQFNDIVTKCFDKVQIMQKALKKAFEDFINKDNRVSKLLAKFVNDCLKKGSKIQVGDLESTLDNIVFLYGYISEKDVFGTTQEQGTGYCKALGIAAFVGARLTVCGVCVGAVERDYQIFLSNRLLMGSCESEHAERSMIAKLKTECGQVFNRHTIIVEDRLEELFGDDAD
jgi:cullin 1